MVISLGLGTSWDRDSAMYDLQDTLVRLGVYSGFAWMVTMCALCGSFDDLIAFFSGFGEQEASASLFRAGSMGGELEGQAVKVMPCYLGLC